MSVRHRLSHPKDGWNGNKTYPKLVITAEGIDDVYRLARVMEAAQVEFAHIGRKTLIGLDRKYPGVVRWLIERMGPTKWGYRGRKPRRGKP